MNNLKAEAARQQQQQEKLSRSSESVMPSSNSGGVVISETLHPLNSSSAINAGLPLLIQHSSSVVAPQPAGHLIPTNVRPPQCLAAAAVGSAYIPSTLTGSPFFHAAPSAPPCISRNPKAPTLAALTNRLGAPILAQEAADIRNYVQKSGQQNQQESSSTARCGSRAETLPWPPPNSVSMGFGNIRSAMETAGPDFAANKWVLPANNNKPFSVISVPNQQAILYNKAAEDLTRSLKSMGCFTIKNPLAATLSKQLLAANKKPQTPQEPKKEEELAAALAAAAEAESRERERLAKEAEQKAKEEEEARKKLQEIDASQLLCLAGPSPAELREMRAREAERLRQRQEEMLRQQQIEQMQLQQQHSMMGIEQIPHNTEEMWSGAEVPYCDYPPPEGQQQQTDREYLRRQILLQEQRISELHQQLMQHQQSREEQRPNAVGFMPSPDYPEDPGLCAAEPHSSAPEVYEYDTVKPQLPQRNLSSSTKGSSRQTSDEKPKNVTVDGMLADFLKTNGLDSSLFRRVRNGVYFYGRTKLLMKIQRGQLCCKALHLTHEQQQQQQQRFVSVDRFLKEQGAFSKPCSC